jgi:hypothetical protein
LTLTASRGVFSKWLVINLDARERKRFPSLPRILSHSFLSGKR